MEDWKGGSWEDSIYGVSSSLPSLPPQTLPAVSTRAHGFQPLRVTEYMVRNMVPGMGTFPQWIELYNPNSVDINIAGWHLTTVSFKNGVKFLTTLTINNWGNIQ